LRRLYQHRREILRAIRSDTNTYAYCDCHGHADRNANAVHGEMHTNAKAPSDPSAAPVGLKLNDEIRISNDELMIE